MTPDSARELVHKALHQVAPDIDVDDLDGQASLRDDLALDSIDFLGFVETLSTSTGHRIDESDYPKLASVDDCVAFLAA